MNYVKKNSTNTFTMKFNSPLNPVRHLSNINRIGWTAKCESKTNVLRVEFHNGKQYDYWPVTQKEYTDLLKAKSIGSEFNQKIKKKLKIEYVEVIPEDLSL